MWTALFTDTDPQQREIITYRWSLPSRLHFIAIWLYLSVESQATGALALQRLLTVRVGANAAVSWASRDNGRVMENNDEMMTYDDELNEINSCEYVPVK